jgi:sec-independent protein translocase protein TatB
MFLFLGPTDMAAIFVIALLLFGPDQLPKVARQLGDVMRHMQTTTHTFMLEMDRAARETDIRPTTEPDAFAASETDADEGGEILPESHAEALPEATSEIKQSPVEPEPEPPAGDVK